MAYGIKYKCQFKSSLDKAINVYILKKDYNSAQIELIMSGNPVNINYLGDEAKYDIIRGSECVLEFMSEYDGQFSEIMLADAMDFQVQIWKENIMIWQGYVIQDNYSEPYQAAPYKISIRATDGLGNLKHYDFQSDDTSFYLNDMTFMEVIQKSLAKLKNATKLVTSIDVFESRISRTNDLNEALSSIAVNPYLFIKDDLNTLKCDVILEYILEIFNSYICYKNDAYYIERVNYKVNDNIVRRVYDINSNGALSVVDSPVTTENIVGYIGRDKELKPVNADQDITYIPAYNKIQIDSDVVTIDNVLVNSYFRNWNNSTNTPYNWVKSGNFSIAKYATALTGDAIKVTQKTQNDSDLNYNSDKLMAQKVNFQSGKGDRKLSIKIASFGNVRILVKANTADKSYYLECSNEIVDLEVVYTGYWKEYPTYCKIERNIVNVRNYSDWYVTDINDMNVPNDIVSLEFGLLPSYDSDIPGRLGQYTDGYRIREFSPKLTNSVDSDTNDQRYLITSNKLVKETYTDLAPTIGEFSNAELVNQTLINGVVTKDWYRDGKTEAQPLLSIAGQSILNQYRTPYRQFSGSLYGDFDFGKVYIIDSLPNKYMPFKASMSLKNDTTSAELFELLPDEDDAADTKQRLINYKAGYSERTNTVLNNGNVGRN